jgi:hypothetical protein
VSGDRAGLPTPRASADVADRARHPCAVPVTRRAARAVRRIMCKVESSRCRIGYPICSFRRGS